MGQDWFRNESWTAEAERDFRARLAQARPGNRAQYLSIQAMTLAAASPPFHADAIALLEELIRDHDAPTFLSDAWRQIGESRAARGDETGAVEAYERGVEAMRAFPQVRTRAPILLALHIAETGVSPRYDDALALLDEFDRDTLFPDDRFERYAVRALIHDARGEANEAAFQAGAAIAAAERDGSGLARHPELGLVGPRHAALLKRMHEIAEPPPSVVGRLKSLFR